jgi:hypothetical protein
MPWAIGTPRHRNPANRASIKPIVIGDLGREGKSRQSSTSRAAPSRCPSFRGPVGEQHEPASIAAPIGTAA